MERTVLGYVSVAALLAAWVIQSEVSQAVQTGQGYNQPVLIVYLNHAVLVLLLPMQIGMWYVDRCRRRGRGESPQDGGIFAAVWRSHRLSLTRMVVSAAGFAVIYFAADLAWYAALPHLSVAAGTAMFNSSCVFAFGFGAWLLGERVSVLKVLGVGVALLGVAIVAIFPGENMAGGGRSVPLASKLVAASLVLLAAALYGYYEVLFKLVVESGLHPPRTIGEMACGCGLSGTAVEEENSREAALLPPQQEVVAVEEAPLYAGERDAGADAAAAEKNSEGGGIGADVVVSNVMSGIIGAVTTVLFIPALLLLAYAPRPASSGSSGAAALNGTAADATPLTAVLDWISPDPLRLPTDRGVMGALALNAALSLVFNIALMMAITLTSSPLIVSVGCMLTIPITAIADFLLHGDRFSLGSVLGSAAVVAGFVALTAADILHQRATHVTADADADADADDVAVAKNNSCRVHWF